MKQVYEEIRITTYMKTITLNTEVLAGGVISSRTPYEAGLDQEGILLGRSRRHTANSFPSGGPPGDGHGRRSTSMGASLSLHMTRHALLYSLLGVWLWVLATCLPMAVLGQANYATPYTFTTLAGNNGYGSADGTNGAAGFAFPMGAVLDSAGNAYVGDTINHTIRKMTPVGTDWVVTTIAGLAGSAGSADGTGSAARFSDPSGVALDANGTLYVADTGNNTIREVTPVGTNWVVTTLAGRAGVLGSANGTGTNALFYRPFGVAVNSAGDVYVADTYNDTIRKVTPAGVVTTLAGLAGNAGFVNGPGSSAQFNTPFGVAVDSATNVYVADTSNNAIRRITPAGAVTTLAGNGTSGTNDGSAARFQDPYSVAVDSATNIYVADTYNFTIRKVTPVGASWVVTTLAGRAGQTGSADGTNSAALFNYPIGVAVDSATNLYVADGFNSAIRHVAPVGTNWVVTTIAGLATGGPGSADGTGSAARFNSPFGVAVDSATNVYVADFSSDTIRKVTPAGVVTTLAGLAGHAGSVDAANSTARFNGPSSVAVDTHSNVYVADWGNHTIRKITLDGTNWVVTTLAGLAGSPGFVPGTGSGARFDYPNGVAVDTNGNVYVADTGNAAIRKVTPLGAVTTLSTGFSGPTGVAVDTNGNVYVADYYSDTIRKVTPAGGVTIIAGLSGVPGSADGTGSAARFNGPYGVGVDSATNIYVADYFNSTIRKVTPVGATWVVTTLAGWPGSFGGADGTGSAAGFFYLPGVAVDSAGDLYVADEYNNAIRRGFPASSGTGAAVTATKPERRPVRFCNYRYPRFGGKHRVFG